MSMAVQTQAKVAPTIKPIPLHAQSGLLQRCGADGECAECRAKRLGLQRSTSAPTVSTPSVPPIVHEVLGSSGHPLDAGARAYMEPRFGHDFSNVRVHTDSRAAESAREVNALAYTVGRDMVFGTGRYAPDSSEGRKLMAHELTHVVQQQNSNTNRVQTSLIIGDANDHREQEAEQVAKAVVYGGTSVNALPEVAGLNPVLRRVVGPCPDTSTPHTLLKLKSQNPAVREAQRKLNQFHNNEIAAKKAGLKDAPLVEDCIFGEKTYNAVLSFQKLVFPKRPAEYDGIIGDHTWKELDKVVPIQPPPTDIRKFPVDFEVKTDREGQIRKDGKIIEPDMKVKPKTLKPLTPTEDKPIDSKYHLVVQVGPLSSIPGSPLPQGSCEGSSLVVGGKYNWEGIPVGKKLSLLGEPELDINVLPDGCKTSPGATIQTNLLKVSILKDVFEASLQGIFGLNDNWIKTWGLTGGGAAELDYKFGCKKLGRINMSSTLFGTLTWSWKQGTGGNPDTTGVNGLLGLKFELPDDCDK